MFLLKQKAFCSPRLNANAKWKKDDLFDHFLKPKAASGRSVAATVPSARANFKDEMCNLPSMTLSTCELKRTYCEVSNPATAEISRCCATNDA